MNAESLQGKYLLDTNILVYTFDAQAPYKRETARQLVDNALSSQQGIISSQVVQEFLNVALRKFITPMRMTDARNYLNTVLRPLCQHFPSLGFYEKTLLIREETGYSFFDAMIVTAAIEADCKLVISEDLQDGRTVRGVKILNPFL